MYNVVFRTIAKCETVGAITWTSFRDKEYFDGWYNEKMRSWYQVVEENVSEERAIELCSSPDATRAVTRYLFNRLIHLRKLLGKMRGREVWP